MSNIFSKSTTPLSLLVGGNDDDSCSLSRLRQQRTVTPPGTRMSPFLHRCCRGILFVQCYTALLVCVLSFSPPAYKESLTVTPLTSDDVLLRFHFEVTRENTASSQHYRVFPKSIGRIIDNTGLEELHLSITQGRWLYEKWGTSYSGEPVDGLGSNEGSCSHTSRLEQPNGVKEHPVDENGCLMQPHPSGAEISAVFARTGEGARWQAVPEARRWSDLLGQLGGIFCASLNQINNKVVKRNPLGRLCRDHFVTYPVSSGQTHWWQGVLPREAVCTENLTPFLKLLPCRHRQGLGQFLSPAVLYKSKYHSFSVHILPVYETRGTVNSSGAVHKDFRREHIRGWRVVQSIVSVVKRPQQGVSLYKKHLAPSSYHVLIRSLLHLRDSGSKGSTLTPSTGFEFSSCPLAAESTLWVHLPAALCSGPWALWDCSVASAGVIGADAVREEQKKSLGSARVFERRQCTFPAGDDYAGVAKWHRFNLNTESITGVSYLLQSRPVTLQDTPTAAPTKATHPVVGAAVLRSFVRMERYFVGMVALRGHIRVDLLNLHPSHTAVVTYSDAIAWFLKTFSHTLSVRTEGKDRNVFVRKGGTRPAEFSSSSSSSSTLGKSEAVVGVDDVALETAMDVTVELWMGADDGRPYQHRLRMALPPNSLTTISIEVERRLLTVEDYPPDASRGLDMLPGALVLHSFQPGGSSGPDATGDAETVHALLHTDPMLIYLLFPDASMPFNVIAFTCTIYAVFFGSFFGALFIPATDLALEKTLQQVRHSVAYVKSQLSHSYLCTSSRVLLMIPLLQFIIFALTVVCPDVESPGLHAGCLYGQTSREIYGGKNAGLSPPRQSEPVQPSASSNPSVPPQSWSIEPPSQCPE